MAIFRKPNFSPGTFFCIVRTTKRKLTNFFDSFYRLLTHPFSRPKFHKDRVFFLRWFKQGFFTKVYQKIVHSMSYSMCIKIHLIPVTSNTRTNFNTFTKPFSFYKIPHARNMSEYQACTDFLTTSFIFSRLFFKIAWSNLCVHEKSS